MNRTIKGAIGLGIAFIICMIGIIGFHVFSGYSGFTDKTDQVFSINKGESLGRIARKLDIEGYVRSRFVFKWTAILLGKSKAFKTGKYRIADGSSAYEVIGLLEKGQTRLIQFTIREGLRMTEIFDLLRKSELNNPGKYEAMVRDPAFIKSLDLPNGVSHLEGFLFPETYRIAEDSNELQVVRLLVKTFFEHLPSEYIKMADAVDLSFYKAVILASIVEKETGAVSEREIISSVFHNRMKKNMRLQTDPTVIYGIKNFDGNITRKQLRTHTVYNTYMIPGLPPTPIASPGLGSLVAAVRPAKSEYLFFVAKGNGRHQFSSNYKAHRQAVYKYQKKRRKDYRSY